MKDVSGACPQSLAWKVTFDVRNKNRKRGLCMLGLAPIVYLDSSQNRIVYGLAGLTWLCRSAPMIISNISSLKSFADDLNIHGLM